MGNVKCTDCYCYPYYHLVAQRKRIRLLREVYTAKLRNWQFRV